MEITVILSQENETLPRAELLARLGTLNIKYEILNEYPGIVELEVDATKDEVSELGAHLAYTHEILSFITVPFLLFIFISLFSFSHSILSPNFNCLAIIAAFLASYRIWNCEYLSAINTSNSSNPGFLLLFLKT